MEKYGVAESDERTKYAQDGEGEDPKCPECGREDVERHGRVVVCPRCGTKPYERRKIPNS